MINRSIFKTPKCDTFQDGQRWEKALKLLERNSSAVKASFTSQLTALQEMKNQLRPGRSGSCPAGGVFLSQSSQLHTLHFADVLWDPLSTPLPSAGTIRFSLSRFFILFKDDFVWLNIYVRLRDVVTANGDLAVQNSDAIKEATSTVHLLMRWNHSNHLDALRRISMNFREFSTNFGQVLADPQLALLVETLSGSSDKENLQKAIEPWLRQMLH